MIPSILLVGEDCRKQRQPMMLNNDFFLSEAMSQGIASQGVPTDPSRVKQLLEEMYKLYDIDLLPLRKCILGVHLIAEFAEQTMLQDERELYLISSLCLRNSRTDTVTTPISTNSVSMDDQQCDKDKD